MAKLLLEKAALLKLQVQGFLAQELVDPLWNRLLQDCPLITTGSQSAQDIVHYDHVKIPPLNGKFRDTIDHFDITIAFSFINGFDLAKKIRDRLVEENLNVQLINDRIDTFDIQVAEERVANSTALLVLLTSDCLKQVEVAFPMSVGQSYYKHASLVLLIHDASSCFFPGYDEHPPSLRPLFSEKAITFLPCYHESGIAQIIEKYQSEKKILKNVLQTENSIAQTIYKNLCNKHGGKLTIDGLRKTLIAARQVETNATNLSESDIQEIDDILKQIDKDNNSDIGSDYFIFSDLIAAQTEFCTAYVYNEKFEKRMTKLRQTVLPSDHGNQVTENIHTRLFLRQALVESGLIVSHKRSTGQGIAGRLYEGLKSKYSVFLDSEAKFKIHNLKQIVENTVVVIRDLLYNLPEELPDQWKPYDNLLRKGSLIWMAEYNLQCIASLECEIGPSDSMISHVSDILSEIVADVKSTGVLKLGRRMLPGSFPALLWILNQNSISNGHNGYLEQAIKTQYGTLEGKEALLQEISSCYLSHIKTIDAIYYRITSLDIYNFKPSLTSHADVFKNVKLILKKVKFPSPRHFKEFFQNNFGASIIDLHFMRSIPDVMEPPIVTPKVLTASVSLARTLVPPPPATSMAPPTAPPPPPGTFLPPAAPPPPVAPTFGPPAPALPSPPPFAAPSSSASRLSNSANNPATPNYVLKKSSLTMIDDLIAKALEGGLSNVRSLIIEQCKITDAGWMSLIRACPLVEHFEVLLAGEISDEAAKQIARLKDLRYVTLPVTSEDITEGTLDYIAEHCEKLEYLQGIPVAKSTTCIDFTEIWSKISTASLEWAGSRAYDNLEELNFSNCAIASRIRAILKNAKKLRILNLSGSNTHDSTLDNIANHAPGLKILNLSRCEVTSGGLRHLQRLSALSSLGLSFCPTVDDSAVEQLTGFRLEELVLEGCHLVTDKGLGFVAKNFPTLKKLSVKDCWQIGSPGLTALGVGCHHLQHLDLDGCLLIDNTGIKNLAPACSKLTHLSLFGCHRINTPGVEAIAPHLKQLTYLNIGGLRQIRNEAAKAIGDNCHDLTVLNITHCAKITSIGFEAIAGLKKLKVLITSKTFLITDMEVLLLSKLNLQEIDLSLCRGIRSDSIIYLGSCKELTRLNLWNSRKISPQGFEELDRCTQLQYVNLGRVSIDDISIFSISKLQNIVELNLAEVHAITNRSLQLIGRSFTKLKYLNLESNTNMDEEGFSYIAQGCRELEKIILADCAKLNDASVDKLTRFCGKLQVLDISNTKELTDKAIQYIGDNCYNINELNIGNLKNLTDQGFKHLKKIGGLLTALNLSGCVQFADSDLIVLAPYIGNLKEFRITGCEQITDKGILSLEPHCHKFVKVNFYACKNITDKSLASLGKYNTGITHIQLTHCSQISYKGIQTLVERNKLQFIDLEKCFETSDRSLEILGKKCPSLLTLRLVKCNQITDKGIKGLAAGCKFLEVLQLSDCDQLTNAAVDYITAGAPHLKYLSLYGCSNITDLSLEYLGSRSWHLERLLLDNTKVTDKGLGKFGQGMCHGLAWLSLENCGEVTKAGRHDIGMKFLLKLLDSSDNFVF